MKWLCLLFIIVLLPLPCFSETEFYKKGMEFYRKSQFELAAAHLEEAKNAEPGNHLLYFYLANAYFEMDDIDNAILNYTDGLNYTDEKGLLFYNLGNCYYLKGNYDFSSEMYGRAVLNDPALHDAYLNAGMAHFQSGNYRGTIIQWETYLEAYPETPQNEKIQRALAYLREELAKPEPIERNIDEKTGLDLDLLNEVIGDLGSMVNNTANIMEQSEKAVDDLTIEGIER